MSVVKCPKCGNQHLKVAVRRLADVQFDEDGGHEVLDTYGDTEFDDDSVVVCALTSEGESGCGHVGTLKEFTASALTKRDKNAIKSLRMRGFAVTVFNADELEGADEERIEDVMQQAAESAIKLLKGGSQ